MKKENMLKAILAEAGVTINGTKPFDVSVYDQRFYNIVLSKGSLGFGETYENEWWDCPALEQLFERILLAHLDEDKSFRNIKFLLNLARAKFTNLQSIKLATLNARYHYDLGNDLYKAMLDKNMIYSCGYWNNGAISLEEAQNAKLDLCCKKLNIKKGQRILDIGCGWGGFAKFVAKKYEAHVVGITISREQASFAKKFCSGLPVEIRLQDYREVNEKFDHIISIGMMEHVGYKNYRKYMEVVHRCLKDEGLFLLHTIGGNKININPDPWINKYIFPNGTLPAIQQIAIASEGLLFMEDWHNFRENYARTLFSWFENFEKNYHTLNKNIYNGRFYRRWKYYLLSCAGAFSAGNIQLWQIIFAKMPGKYKSIR